MENKVVRAGYGTGPYPVQDVLADWIGIRSKIGFGVEILRISSGRGVVENIFRYTNS